MTALVDIGAELVRTRRAVGVTQAELAERLGVKRQQVQRWEASAYRSASLERVSRVAEALGIAASDSRAGLAAETAAAYGGAAPAAERGPASVAERAAGLAASTPPRDRPVRDLGEVITRIREHAAELHERFGVTSIEVFGSFARGEQRPDSDVDLIVEVAEPGIRTVMGSESALSEILGRKAEAGSLDGLNPRVLGRVRREKVHVWPA